MTEIKPYESVTADGKIHMPAGRYVMGHVNDFLKGPLSSHDIWTELYNTANQGAATVDGHLVAWVSCEQGNWKVSDGSDARSEKNFLGLVAVELLEANGIPWQKYVEPSDPFKAMELLQKGDIRMAEVEPLMSQWSLAEFADDFEFWSEEDGATIHMGELTLTYVEPEDD